MLRYSFVVLCASFSAQLAYAENCKIDVKSDDKMQFDKKEIQVDATCKQVEVKLTHTGKFNKSIMGHNWVLFETKNKADVLKTAEKAGPSKDYAPDKSKIIVETKLIGGGETTSVSFSLKGMKAGGDYTFICTMPGHGGMMIGKFIVK